MAGTKISDLPAVPSSLLTDVLPADQGAVTYKETLQQVFTLFQSNGAALTKTDDTNVTLTLGGSPSTALLNAASITAGWSGQLSLARGGTNANLTASNGAIPYSTASAFALLAPGTSGQLLQSGGAGAPSWTTATFPGSAGAAGTVLRSNGTNWISSTSTFADTYGISTLLYASSANTVTGLATTNQAVLSTNLTGVPNWLALTDGQVVVGSTAGSPAAATLTGGTNITITNASNSITIAATTGAGSPLTTKGDLYTYSTVNTRLAVGSTDGQVLQVSSGAATGLAYSTATYPTSTTINELLYSSSANVVSGLATATTAVLTTSAGVPTWASTLSLPLGGTNASLTANNGGIVWSNASQLQILAGTATANLPLLSGSTATPSWGSFALSLGGALTTAGALTTSGAFGATFTFTNTTSVTFPTSGTLATTSQLVTPAALTKGDDTNVTLTLAGSPSTALVNAASITAGWTGQLSLARGGTNANLTASNGGIFYSTASAGAILAGTATAGQVLQSGASAAPSWSTATYPSSTTVNQILYSSSANVVGGISAVNSAVLSTSAGGVPSLSTTLPNGIAATSMVLTTPKVITSINDTNNNTFIGVTATASAVNYVGITNAITGSGVTISSAGSDANINLLFSPKGTGAQVFNNGSVFYGNVQLGTGVSILDQNANLIIGISPTASSVNYINFTNAATANAPIIAAVGSDSNIQLTLNSKGTKGVAIKGVTDASDAAAGYVGEYITSNIPNSSAVSCSTTVARDVTSISLTAGDWDVFGNVFFNLTSVTSDTKRCWTSTTSATLPDASRFAQIAQGSGSGSTGITAPYLRVSVNTTTTVYLSVKVDFAGTSVTASGSIYARRVR